LEQRISAIEVQEKRDNRRSIFVNGRFVLGVDESVISDLGLHVGQEITEDELQNVVRAEMIEKAKDRALRLLEYRARSRAEIARRLRKADFPEDILEDVLARLESLGLIDDAQFSQDWVNHRVSGKKMGKRRIQYELRQKGISTEVAEEALSSIDSDVEYETAKEAARRRWTKDAGADERTKRQRLASFLQRQGFDWEIIKRVTNDLTTEAEEEWPES